MRNDIAQALENARTQKQKSEAKVAADKEKQRRKQLKTAVQA
jgi:hypothetical protein